MALAAATSACSFEPIRQVEATSSPAEPATLAFNDPVVETEAVETEAVARTQPVSDPATAADEPGRQTSAGEFLEEREPGAWAVATSDASIGVHSAPDYLFTRLGILGPGENVIGTGRRVATDAVSWMEIRWGDATAWVIEAAFTPLS